MLGWRCHQLQSRFIGNDHFPRVPRQSRLSANDEDDNEMIAGAVAWDVYWIYSAVIPDYSCPSYLYFLVLPKTTAHATHLNCWS